MKQAMWDNVLVEEVKDESIFSTTGNREYKIVKVLKLPTGIYAENGQIIKPHYNITVGSNVLTEGVKQYNLPNGTLSFTKLRDIICVL